MSLATLSERAGGVIGKPPTPGSGIWNLRSLQEYVPLTIPGLEAWFDASDIMSVTLDSGRVAELRDKSGKGRHSANSTSGSTQPDYVTAARNGRNVARFSAASSQKLTIASSTAAFNFLHNGTESYVVAVSSYATSDNPGVSYSLFGNGGGSSSAVGLIYYYADGGVGANNGLVATVARGVGGANNLAAATFNSAGTAIFAAFDDIMPPQTTLLQEIVFSVNATALDRIRVRINGGSELTGNDRTGAASASNASYDFQLGMFGNNAGGLEGDICELLIFSQAPTAAARTALRRYLAAKWGVTLV